MCINAYKVILCMCVCKALDLNQYLTNFPCLRKNKVPSVNTESFGIHHEKILHRQICFMNCNRLLSCRSSESEANDVNKRQCVKNEQ